jgi:hypothetical protein
MGQRFCTGCGAPLSGGLRFCENCGAKIDQEPDTGDTIKSSLPVSGTNATTPPGMPADIPGKKPIRLVAAIIVIACLAIVVVFGVLPAFTSGSSGSSGKILTPVPTPVPQQTVTSTVLVSTETPAPAANPYPNALALKERMPFGSGKVASMGTVYRYWINDSYSWHNDMDNKYYTQKASEGSKYLVVFVQMMNIGDTRVWLPPARNIVVHFSGATYTQDESHYKPDAAGSRKTSPVEIQEIQYFYTLNGDDYVEDFGFSNGMELGYIYPGKSNAVDGYIVYNVPQSLTPEKTFVEIPFNGQDTGIWKLA